MNTPTSLRPRKLVPNLLAAGAVAAAVLSAVNSSAGIQGSGLRSLLAVGTVTDTGNGGTLSVSGTSYPTAGATFQVDGRAASPGQIQNGDVVWLVARASPGAGIYSATQVIFNGSVQGAVSAIDPASGTFVVLGQTIHVGTGTVFAPNLKSSGLAGLSVGDTVEVSAYFNSVGDQIATRIDERGQNSVARVTGSVHNLDATRHTFYIKALKVDYRSAQVESALVENSQVAVQGNSVTSGGTLIADSVRTGTPAHGLPGGVGRIQGLITAYASSSYFEVDGQPVIVSDETQLHLGRPLALDVPVLISGTFDTDGALVAKSVTSTK